MKKITSILKKFYEDEIINKYNFYENKVIC